MWSILWPLYVPLTVLHGSSATSDDGRSARGVAEVLSAGLHYPPYSMKIPYWLHPDVSFDCKQPGYFGDTRKCEQFYQCVALLTGHLVRYVFKCTENRVFSAQRTGCVKLEETERDECLGKSGQARVPVSPANALGVADSAADKSLSQETDRWSATDEEEADVSPTSLDYLEENTVIADAAEKSGRVATASTVDEDRPTMPVDGTTASLVTIGPSVRDSSSITVPPLPIYASNESRSESESESESESDVDSDTGYDCDESNESCDDETTVLPRYEDDESSMIATTTPTATIVAGYAVPLTFSDVPCTEQGFFSDPGNCSVFYRCVPFGYSFVKHRFSCPSGTIWDGKQETCNFPANVERAYLCKYDAYSVSMANAVRLPSIVVKGDSHAADSLTGDRLSFACPTGFRRYPNYCNTFYQCTINDQLEVNFVPFACPPGTVFDDEQIRCAKNDTAPTDCNVYRLDEGTVSMRVIKVRGLAKFCTEEGQYPYGEICPTNYFKCVRNEQGSLVGYLLDCPQGQLFSPAASGCVSIATFPFCARRYTTSLTRLNAALTSR